MSGGWEGERQREKHLPLMTLLWTQRVFNMGNRRPAPSPSLCRDRAQREAVTSPGSHSRSRRNSVQQTRKTPADSSSPASCLLPPRHPTPLQPSPSLLSPWGHSQQGASSCLGKTAPPSQLLPQVSPSPNRLGPIGTYPGTSRPRSEVTQGQVGRRLGRRWRSAL